MKLKKCPFCGSGELIMRWVGDMVQVHCDKCGGSGGYGKNVAAAAYFWNLREWYDE